LVRFLGCLSGVVLSTFYWKKKSRVYAASGVNEADLELVQLQVITRHGARTPLVLSGRSVDGMFTGTDPYNWECEDIRTNDPSIYLQPEGKEIISYDEYKKIALHSFEKPKIFGSCVDAQLTLLGMQQSLDFGNLLRERYINTIKFLSPNYNSKDVWIRSSNTSRTILTSRQVMRGIYPPEYRSPDAKVILNIATNENLYPAGSCDKFNSLKKNFRKEQNELMEKMRSILSKAENPFWHNRQSIGGVTNNLNTFVDHKFPLPKGLTEEDFNKISSLSGQQYISTYPNDEIQKLAIGRFIGDITTNITQAINSGGIGGPKLIMYSGHDNTLAPILVSFGALDGTHPRMGSAVILELWKHKRMDRYYLKLFFYDPVQKLKSLQFANYPPTIPTEDYFSLVKNKIPKDFAAECKLEDHENIST